MIKALPVDIFKSNLGDCSNNGISSKFNKVLIVCDKGFIDIDESDIPENLCVVEQRYLWGEPHFYVRPFKEPEHLGWMSGGCICDSSDSRWNDISGGIPLHLHDRQETQKQYDVLSH